MSKRKRKINWRDGVVLAAVVTTLGGTAPVSGGQPTTPPSASSVSPEITDTLKAKVDGAFNAGLNALEHGNVGQAIDHFEEAIRLDPDHADARFHLANVLQIKRDLDRILEQKLKQTTAIDWRSPTIVAAIMTALFAALAAAIGLVIKSRKGPIAPTPIVAVDLGTKDAVDKLTGTVGSTAATVSAMKQELKALRTQMAETQLAPQQPVPHSPDPLKVKAVEFYNAGWEAQNNGKIGQAIGHYLDALKLRPHDSDAHNNLGVALKAKGDLDGAIEQYNEGLRLDPDHANAHNNLGVALKAKGDLDGAVQHYNEALRLDPDHAVAHYNLASTLRAKGDLDGAIEHCNEAVRIDPDLAFAHNNLGVALVVKGDFDGAIEHHNEGLRIDPDDAYAHYNIGCAQCQKMDSSAAVAALAKAIQLDSKLRDVAKTDTDYDPIRDDPGFRKLVYVE